jgi:hypothetical protein
MPGLQITNLAYARAPIDNPLKGIMANTGHSQSARDRFPHSLIFAYIPLRDAIIGPTNFVWNSLEAVIKVATNDHCQLVPRFFLDYPGWTNSAIPQYLLDGGLQTWTYTDYGNKNSLFPNYEDPNLRAALTNFIAAYGARYDGDPRIAFVQIGTIGVWGEWHYGGASMLPHWASLTAQAEVVQAYVAAFKKTKVLFRYPAGTNNDAGGVATFRNDDLPLGYYDDAFCTTTVPMSDVKGPPEWGNCYQMAEMRLAGATDHWKQWPYGGETYYAKGACIFSNPPCVIGVQTWSNCVRETHASFVHVASVFYTNSYNHGTNALWGAYQLGYELSATQFSTWTNGADLICQLVMTNTGVAPFYYSWSVELAAASSNGVLLRTWSTPWDITKIIPGEGPQQFTTTVSNPPPTPFIMLMRVINPLSAGKPLRFANVSQDATVTNWLTLGEVR